MNQRRIVWMLVLAIASAILGSYCHGGTEDPTPQCVDSRPVLIDDPAYVARTEPIQAIPGRLSKDCTKNSRYCYYLVDGQVGVYTLGNQTVLDAYVGRSVVISGKVVFPSSGPGEVWPGTICRFTL